MTTTNRATQIKLTKPQRELLGQTSIMPRHWVDSYKPGKKLLELGLVEIACRGKFGHDKYTITDAGKAWLEAHREGK